jgi:hypothetical protein
MLPSRPLATFVPVQITPIKATLSLSEWLSSPQYVRDRVPCPSHRSGPPMEPIIEKIKYTLYSTTCTTSPDGTVEIEYSASSLPGLEPPEFNSPLQPKEATFTSSVSSKPIPIPNIPPTIFAASPSSATRTTNTNADTNTTNTTNTTTPTTPTTPNTHNEPSAFVIRSPTPRHVIVEESVGGTVAGDIIPSPRTYLEQQRDIIPAPTPTKGVHGPGVSWKVINTARRNSHLFSSPAKLSVENKKDSELGNQLLLLAETTQEKGYRECSNKVKRTKYL